MTETVTSEQEDGAAVEATDEPAAPTTHETTDSPEFRAAVEREVAERIKAAERRWQSKKDREIQRERRRWENDADLNEELRAWIGAASPDDVGSWIKRELAGEDQPATSTPAASEAPELADEFVAAAPETDAGPEGGDAVHDQALARERLVEDRARQVSPDLTPGLSAPADLFRQIEARFARGEIGLAEYEAARRRRGLD